MGGLTNPNLDWGTTTTWQQCQQEWYGGLREPGPGSPKAQVSPVPIHPPRSVGLARPAGSGSVRRRAPTRGAVTVLMAEACEVSCPTALERPVTVSGVSTLAPGRPQETDRTPSLLRGERGIPAPAPHVFSAGPRAAARLSWSLFFHSFLGGETASRATVGPTRRQDTRDSTSGSVLSRFFVVCLGQ